MVSSIDEISDISRYLPQHPVPGRVRYRQGGARRVDDGVEARLGQSVIGLKNQNWSATSIVALAGLAARYRAETLARLMIPFMLAALMFFCPSVKISVVISSLIN
jgi:hypothetical protein